jgi:hypothetical protein
MNDAIYPFWDDLRTDRAGGGVFTSTNGSAPNRVFNIEWRAVYFTDDMPANFQARLYEANGRIEFVYGTMSGGGSSATVGVQRSTGTAFTSFSCNAPNITNGLQVNLSCPTMPSISGTVLFETAAIPGPVPGVSVAGAGSPSVMTMTDAGGAYTLTGFGQGSYTVTPSKADQPFTVPNGIFSNDAALISRHVVGIQTLSATQLKAATVGGGPNISSFDAGLVAQYIVGIPNAINQSGRWKFTPADRSYASVSSGQIDEDYAATLMGDVSGDWIAPAPRWINPATHALPWEMILVSAPDVGALPRGEVIIPVQIENFASTEVTSFQFDVEYDPRVISPGQVAAEINGTMAEGLSVASNSPVPGLLRVVVYGATPVMGDGTYVNLKFSVISGTGSATPINIASFRLNDGRRAAKTYAGKVTVR